jgi:hypothetical protein
MKMETVGPAKEARMVSADVCPKSTGGAAELQRSCFRIPTSGAGRAVLGYLGKPSGVSCGFARFSEAADTSFQQLVKVRPVFRR